MTDEGRMGAVGGPDPSSAPRGRRTWLWFVAAVAIVVALGITAAALLRPQSPSPTAASGPATSAATPPASTSPPLTPPTPVCGSSALHGPSTPPQGAVVVSAGDDLSRATSDSPSGTTFWLAPGTHTLGQGEFVQVRPKEGNRYIGAPGAILDGQGLNRYAFAGDAPDVRIESLTIQNFGPPAGNNNEGVVNHDAGTGWIMSRLTVRNNAGAGVFVGDRNVVEESCLIDNGQYGFSVYSPGGVHDVTLRANEIAGNNTADWEKRRPGCGCTGGGKFWNTTGGTVVDNYVHDNHGPAIWADTNNAGFTFSGNYIADNDGPGIMYETSYNASITGNTFIGNGHATWRNNPGFPTAAIYISESGSDARVDTEHSETFEVADNLFVDNWGGVVAWENADRFSGSPANTSTGSTTLVNPDATTQACSTPELIRTEPYIDDCRWKTQHLRIHDNVFRFSPDALGADCTEANRCGFSGLFSNFGTFPGWSPFQGTIVEKAVTFDQDNIWSDNTYSGPWRFMGLEQGNILTWEEWRDEPFDQDGGSDFAG